MIKKTMFAASPLGSEKVNYDFKISALDGKGIKSVLENANAEVKAVFDKQ